MNTMRLLVKILAVVKEQENIHDKESILLGTRDAD